MDIKNTHRVYQTIIEMLIDRGYNISQNVDYDDFIIMYEESNYDITDDDNKIHVAFFKDQKTFAKKDLENMVQTIKEQFDENINIIIILRDKYNVTIEKELANDLYRNVEIFLFKNLTFNITRHQDIPKHKLLNKSEIEEVKKIYGAKLNQYPKMFVSDPIARYYGAKGGDVFEIIRTSTASGEYKTYRVVR